MKYDNSIFDLKIFKLNRIRYEELMEDAINYVKKTYRASNQNFTLASPFAQLLSVILHLGRMVLYYIEDSITSLNIATASRPDNIKGLAQLTGHRAQRVQSARAAGRIQYNDTGNQELNGRVMYIPNKLPVQNALNGISYIILFGQDTAKMTMQAGNYIDCSLLQGVLKYQKTTSTGQALQSFNFAERNYREIEQYFVNIYVNNEPWVIVDSFNDLTYNQKACVVRTGLTSGIDVFFGNGDFGMIPPAGAVILAEYVVSDGIGGNISANYVNETTSPWKFNAPGYLEDGTQVTLNDNFSLKLRTDLIFGSPSEDITLTQMLAPHTSRSFVLANETNYKYFLEKMGMFSTVEVIKGYSTQEANAMARIAYDKAQTEYYDVFNKWQTAVDEYGESSDEAQALYDSVQNALNAMNSAQDKVEDTDMPDNTVYLMLIPDIKKRLTTSVNYFTCNESLFTLTSDEQYNILQLIENSGQKVITMENRILEPKLPRFAINADVKIWEGHNMQSVYSDCLDRLSQYLLNNTRKDIIPVSDITALFEAVEGVDSVRVWFDADVENTEIYQQEGFYGIDDLGDVVLSRTYTNANGNSRKVRDILPLFRGGFTSPEGVEYSDTQSMDYLSAFNLNVMLYTRNTRLSTTNPIN